MRFSTLDDWLAWLEKLHPREIELGLDRISQVASRMGLAKSPAKRVVTVAGTNGKGSTVAALESVFLAANTSVGSYTSPHLLHYNERIKIGGKPVDEGLICDALSKVDIAREEISLTYFEFGTLAALSIFTDHQLDVVLLEVGLGGRLDAVNIIDPDIAVITRIDIDHIDWLGADRETIALEKAGIMRPSIPVVCADNDPPESLKEVADQLGCHWNQYGIDFFAKDLLSVDECQKCNAVNNWSWQGKDADDKTLRIEGLNNRSLPMPSMAAAMQVVNMLDCAVSEENLRSGINNAILPGRLQKVVFSGSDILLDVAHNTAGAQYLADYLYQNPVAGKNIAVFAVMSDKEISQIISAIKPQIDYWCLADLELERAAEASELTRILRQQGVTDSMENHGVSSALACAASLCEMNDRIVVFGSFYTVAEVLHQLNIMKES